MISLFAFLLAAQPFVTVQLREQLGNQMFEVAAAYSLALSHGAELIVPDFATEKRWNSAKNYEDVFFRISSRRLPRKVRKEFWQTTAGFEPISYTPDIKLVGLFFSEKYFEKHKEEVRALFAPKEEIVSALHTRFPEVFSEPLTVAVHIRTYNKDDPAHQTYLFLGWDYFKEVISEFPAEALFVVCSDQIDEAEKELSGFRKKMLFVKEQPYTHDLYLMSFCDHHILSNSTFSWWSAYLNPSRGKIVIAPKNWYNPRLHVYQGDYFPREWCLKDNDPQW